MAEANLKRGVENASVSLKDAEESILFQSSDNKAEWIVYYSLHLWQPTICSVPLFYTEQKWSGCDDDEFARCSGKL